MFLLTAVLLSVFEAGAQAPLEQPGSPVWTLEGPGLSDHGSRWMLQTDLYDHPEAFSMLLRDGWADGSTSPIPIRMAPVEAYSRQLTRIDVWGWAETIRGASDVPLAEGRVFTAGRDVFGLEIRSLSAAPVAWVLSGEGPPLTHLQREGAPVLPTQQDANGWSVDIELGGGERTVIFFAASALPEDAFAETVAPLWDIGDWEAELMARWEGWRELPGAITSLPNGRIPEAIALLRHARSQVGASVLPLRAKGETPRVELESIGLLARAFAQLGPERGAETAEALLSAFQAAQNDAGALPAWLAPTGTTLETRVPRFLTGWVSIAERLGDDQRAQAMRRQALAVEREVLRFWTENRDRDGDAAIECDGGREAGTPGSPRLSEVWSEEVDEPLGTLTNRLPLNCVEAGAWNHALAVEAARLATLLGEDATALRTLASRRALEVEDPVNGHWAPDQAGWFDYVRVGGEKTRETLETRTHVLWAPLTTGLSRESARVRGVVEQLLDPTAFLREGVVSVAMDTRSAAYDPNAPWRGAIQPEVEWSALVALSRYGYEAQAQTLRQQLMSRGLAAFSNPDGLPLGPSNDAVAAAIHLLAAAHVDEEEVLLFEQGNPQAKRRSGHFQRLFHATDGRLLLEVVSADPRLRPRLTLISQTQLFSGEPMELEVSDPSGVLGQGTVEVQLPAFASATGTIIRADGSSEPFSARRDGDAPIRWTAGAGDRLVLSESAFSIDGGTGCGCSGTGSAAPSAWVGLLLLLLGWRGAVRRRHGD